MGVRPRFPRATSSRPRLPSGGRAPFPGPSADVCGRSAGSNAGRSGPPTHGPDAEQLTFCRSADLEQTTSEADKARAEAKARSSREPSLPTSRGAGSRWAAARLRSIGQASGLTGVCGSASASRRAGSLLRRQIAGSPRLPFPPRRPRRRGAGRRRATASRSSARSGDSGDSDLTGPGKPGHPLVVAYRPTITDVVVGMGAGVTPPAAREAVAGTIEEILSRRHPGASLFSPRPGPVERTRRPGPGRSVRSPRHATARSAPTLIATRPRRTNTASRPHGSRCRRSSTSKDSARPPRARSPRAGRRRQPSPAPGRAPPGSRLAVPRACAGPQRTCR